MPRVLTAFGQESLQDGPLHRLEERRPVPAPQAAEDALSGAGLLDPFTLSLGRLRVRKG